MGGLWLSRLLLQRGLALLYLVAFLNAWNQFPALVGEHGLLPLPRLVRQTNWRELPSLLHFAPRDWAVRAIAGCGIGLAALAALGWAQAGGAARELAVWALLWLLYLSLVNAGQTFYSFGWESILLEAGFFAMWLGPAGSTPPAAAIWLERWLLFRVMFGAGMIKLRGDRCWRDLTCLDYHYETQPMPNPLSWYFHHGPAWTRRAGVLVNHLLELAVPFAYFLPQPVAAWAGWATIAFQLLIALSGNLAWLNWLTIVLAASTLSGGDRVLSPIWLRFGADATAVLIVFLSVPVVINLLSPRQRMNTGNRWHLGGSYGAFGSITRPRVEIVLEGTLEAVPGANDWREYEFKAKPGDVARLPPQIAPYHLRLDWLMWFAALSSPAQQAWFLRFVGKLLEADPATLRLLRRDPFAGAAPRRVRARRYIYRFATPAERARDGTWWRRESAGEALPPLSLDNAGFVALLEELG